MKFLSRSDELVLLSVWRLQENAYGVPIRKHLKEVTAKEWSVGAVYDSLEKLTSWGCLNAADREPSPQRGGRRKRFYKVTPMGVDALKRMKQLQEGMWHNLPQLDFTSN